MDTSLESSFPGQQLYNKIMKKFSITAYVIFSTLERPYTCFLPLSLTWQKNGYIIGIPFLTSTRLSYKKYKDTSFGRVTSPLSNMTGRFSDLSVIQNILVWNIIGISFLYESTPRK